MKKIFSVLFVLCLISATLVAAPLSSPAATVNLIRNEVITMAELNEEVELYKSAGYTDVTEAQVLEEMISSRLFYQGAERDGFVPSEKDLDAIYANQKASAEAQLGQALTDAQFEEIVVSQYGSVEYYREYLKSQIIMNNYVDAKKASIIDNVEEPTEREIKNWYRQNQTTLFAQGETFKLSIITKAKTGDTATDNASKAELEKVYQEIKSGKITFEKGVQLYSTDEASKTRGGDIGWMVDNDIARANVGDEFVDAVVDLDVGEYSGVVSTPSDWCIVKVTSYQPAKILTLDDPITPEDTITVRDYIASGLAYQKAEMAFIEAYQDLLNDLLKEAKINRIVK